MGDIDGSGIFERRFGLSENLLQEVGFVLQEVADVLCSLLFIAAMTGQRQVAHPLVA
jgi:hypothetical protein